MAARVPLSSLPREGHESRVEHKRQEEMRDGNGGHGEDGDEVGDAPVEGNERRDGEDDHAGDEGEREEHREFELREVKD